MYLIVDERKNGGKYVIKMSELIKKALSLFCWSVLFVWKDYIAPQCTYKRMDRRIQNCCNIQDRALCDNGFQPLTIITKCSILDVETVLDPSLIWIKEMSRSDAIDVKILSENMRSCQEKYLTYYTRIGFL